MSAVPAATGPAERNQDQQSSSQRGNVHVVPTAIGSQVAASKWTVCPRSQKPCVEKTITDLITSIRVQETTVRDLKEVACQTALDYAADLAGPRDENLETAIDWLCENIMAIQACEGTAGLVRQKGDSLVVTVTVTERSCGVFDLALFEDYMSQLFHEFDLLSIGLQTYTWTARKRRAKRVGTPTELQELNELNLRRYELGDTSADEEDERAGAAGHSTTHVATEDEKDQSRFYNAMNNRMKLDA